MITLEGFWTSLVSRRFHLPQSIGFVYISIKLASLFYVARACLVITLDQVDFLEWVWAIPSEQRSWKRLVTLDTLHAFCGGSKPTPKAKRLDIFSQVQKWSLGRTSKRRLEKLLLSVLSQVDHRSLL